MIATRLSPVWQVGGVALAALGCYLVSQSVAAERASLARVDRQIAAEQDAIAKLSTEIATRSRLTQIESWNRQLALQAPRPGQYVDSGFQLASLYARDRGPQLPLNPAVAAPAGPVRMVSLKPAAPATVRPAPDAPRVLPAVLKGQLHNVAPPVVAAAAQRPAQLLPPGLLQAAAYVQPKPRLLDGAAPAPAKPLLSADIAGLAQAEQARRQPPTKSRP